MADALLKEESACSMASAARRARCATACSKSATTSRRATRWFTEETRGADRGLHGRDRQRRADAEPPAAPAARFAVGSP